MTDEDVNSLYQKVSYQRQSVHDPSIIKDGDEYYVFGSHMGVAKTADLMNWSSTAISDQNKENAYYGLRDEQGNVTKVPFAEAFGKGAYGTKTVETADGSSVEVDFGSMPASDWNTAVGDYVVEGNMWAPDILYNENMGKYCMYLSLNGSKWNSVVILLTSENIEGPYVYEAPIVYSGFTESKDSAVSYTKTDLKYVINNGQELSELPSRYKGFVTNGSYGSYWPHAIDPFVFYDDDNKLWLGYGSWSGGIYMIELDEKTGLRDYTVTYPYEVNGKGADASAANENVTSDPYFGKKIAGGWYNSGEGAYVEKMGNYYYLFVSYGFYSPTGGYNMRVFRSEKPDGPYVDINGTSAIYTSRVNNFKSDSRGLQLMGNYQWNTMSVGEAAQGHNSAFVDDDGNAYVIYHTKFANDTADHQLRVHQLYQNEDGWIVAAPYEYAGEKVNDETIKSTEIPKSEIAGDYDLIVHQYSNPKAADEGTVAANLDVVKPVEIILKEDGTIDGAYTGTWEEKSGTAYATITINGTEYKGVFTKQTVDGTNIETMCFSAVKKSGSCIWGSKKLGDNEIVAYNAKNEKIKMPLSTSQNLTLYQGELGAEVTWSSSNTSALSDNGTVSPADSDQEIILTKTITKGDYYYQKKYPVTVYGTESSTGTLMSYDRAGAGDVFMPVSSINANTGVSLTFTETGITSDWTPVFITGNGEYVYLSVLNYGGTNIFETSGTLSSEAKDAGIVNPWDIFTDGQRHKVTISYNVNGSIEFYRDDVLMLTYAAGTAIGKSTVAALSKALAQAVRQGTLTAKYGMEDVSIGYAKDYDGTEIDTSGYLYYQDFETAADPLTIWKSAYDESSITIDNDNEYGNYFHFIASSASGNRSASTDFFDDGSELKGRYTVEADVVLSSGNNSGSQAQFVIASQDSGYTGDPSGGGVNEKYILKLSASGGNTDQWKINDAEETVTIPNTEWTHIKASVDTDNKIVNVVITTNGTTIHRTVSLASDTGLKGLYVLKARGGFAKVDNIKVYESQEENTGNITTETKGKLYLDKASPVTLTFKTDGKLSKNDTISIDGTPVKKGSSVDKITVNDITYSEQEISVDMTVKPIEGWHNIKGSFDVALLDSFSSEVKTQTLQYDLDSLSENSAYAKIITTEENSYTSGYYKVVGTKLYFMTIVKSDKIHCAGIAAGDKTYEWYNGICSEVYMSIDGKKYSVGSHANENKWANPIVWGEGILTDLIKDGSSVVRGYMALGTFDNDDDTDIGCVLLNVVDLADIGYTADKMPGTKFTLSGYLGPNDFGTNGDGSRFIEVDGTKEYKVPGYSAEISGNAYPDTENEVTVVFQSDGTMNSDSVIKINETPVKVGDTVNLATVKDIVFGNGTAQVILTMAPMSGWHSVPGIYDVALCDALGNNLAENTIEYELSVSDNTEYKPIKTEDNPNSSAYYKVNGTKMYFMTILKSDKIHCDQMTVDGTAYGWWSGINSELYMTMGGKKYSVGSHTWYNADENTVYANAVGWGTGTSDNSFENDLITGSNVVRGYMAFGSFDNDNDTDKGCILLNVVELKDIGYTLKTLQGETFTLSGYLGANDGKGGWTAVNGSEKYTFPSYSAEISGKAYLDKGGRVTAAFTSSEPIQDAIVKVNGVEAEEGTTVGLATVESIVNQGSSVEVVLAMAGMNGENAIPGSYLVALTDSSGEELVSAAAEYSLELSEDTEYQKIMTVAENPYTSSYYKMDGTKMSFLTIVKSDKIHCDGVTAGETEYGWSNGINSELYMSLDGKKYSVGSHVYLGTLANAIGWGNGTENGSFENTLITGRNVVRGFLALGTFDNDEDTDTGCALLNVVDLADISYSQPEGKPFIISFSGFLGPNDGGQAFVQVSPDAYYVTSEGTTHICTRAYTEPECETDGYYTYQDQDDFEYRETEENSATGHLFTASYKDSVISVECTKGDAVRKVTLKIDGGTVSEQYNPKMTETTIFLPTMEEMTKEGASFAGWSNVSSGEVLYQGETELSELFSEGEEVTLYAIWGDTEAPTGAISIAESRWDSFLEKITFGIYKSTQEVITIEAEDNVGVESISYLIATEGKTYTLEELKTLPEENWKAYDASSRPKLEKDTKNVVYAKLKDAAGNTAYLSSDGMVEDETVPEITDFKTVPETLTDTGVSLQIEVNEDGVYYLALCRDSEDTLKEKDKDGLAAAVVSAAGEGQEISAGTAVSVSREGLQRGKDYNAYLVVKDKAGNYSECSSLSFRTALETAAITETAITGDPVYGESLKVSAKNEKDLGMAYQWYRSEKTITEATDIGSLTEIPKAQSVSYKLQKEDVGKYLAVVVTIAEEGCSGSGSTYLKTAVQPKTATVSAEVSDKEYDGTVEASVAGLTVGNVIDGDEVTASEENAAFEDANAGTEKNVVISGIRLSGADASYYQLEETTVTVLASISKSKKTPNLPDASETWSVAYDTEFVKDVELPEGWAWLEADAGKELAVGTEVKATAVYSGTDKGNYEVEEVQITICRSSYEPEETDSEAPTGAISIAESRWDSFLEKITFGIYKSTQEVITIEAEDNVGVESISYLIATEGKTYALEELKTLPEESWKAYDASSRPKLEKDTKNVVYAKLKDAAGNTAYLSSDGMVEDETAPEITDFKTVPETLTDTGVSLQIEVNEDGVYYLALCKDSEDTLKEKDGDLAAAVVSAAGEGQEISAGTAVSVSKEGLQRGTDYNAYLVVKDKAGNYSECSSLSFRTALETAAITETAITGNPVYGESLKVSAKNEKDLGMAYQWYRSEKTITEATDIGSLTEIPKAQSVSYKLQKEDVGKYLAVVVTIAEEGCSGSGSAYLKTAVQPRTATVSAEVSDKEYDGTVKASVTGFTVGNVIDGDEVTASEESAVFEDASAGTEKNVVISGIRLSGADASYYQLEETTVTVLASISKSKKTPNLPDASETWSVAYDTEFVKDVELPEGWAWLEADAGKELAVGTEVKATAVYSGTDKGNYEVEEVQITICRSSYEPEETDSEAPTGAISIAESRWDSFLEKITFGIYKSTQELITIEAEDNVGVESISYLIATEGKTYTLEELKTLPEENWKAYDAFSRPKLEKDTKNVVYAKLKDVAGNTAYLSSDGMVEDETAPEITAFKEVPETLTDTGVSLQIEVNEDGVYYLALCKDSEDTLKGKDGLAAAVVSAAGEGQEISADTAVSVSKEGLQRGTDYNAYLVVKDKAGNYSECSSLSFRTALETAAITETAITGDPVYGESLKVSAKNEKDLSMAYQWYRSEKTITEATDIVSLTEIPKAQGASYKIQKEDVGKYLAAVVTIAEEGCSGSGSAYLKTAVQPRTATVSAKVSDKEYDGTVEASVAGFTVGNVIDGDEVTASEENAAFEDANAGTEKNVVISGIHLSGADASYYQLEEATVTVLASISKSKNTPNIPNASETWKVDYGTEFVKDVELPEGWAWLEADAGKELTVGTEIKATAVYSGTDKGNYEVEEVQITICRSSCGHEETEIRNRKDADCTNDGYTGDVYCTACEELIREGDTIQALGHEYDGGVVTKEPTTKEPGIRTYTCKRCEDSYTEEIPKLPEAEAKKLSIAGAVVNNKVYDGSVKAEVASVEFAGNAEGEEISYEASAEFADANAGTGKAVVVTVMLTGGSAEAYFLDNDKYQAAADILKAPAPKVTAPDISVPYGTTLGGISLPEGFAFDVSGLSDGFNTAVGDVGVHKFAAVYTKDVINYETVELEISVNVIQAVPKYTVPAGLTAVYGQTLGMVALPAGFAFEQPETTSVGKVGENAFTVRYTPKDSVNYKTVGGIPVTVTVTKAPAVFEIPTGLTAVYGQTLETVALPAGFAFEDSLDTLVGEAGQHTFLVDYTPDDPETEESRTGIEVVITVLKATPECTVLEALVAEYGKTLEDLKILLKNTGWSFTLPGSTPVGEIGENLFDAVYTPEDTDNYETVAGVIKVLVVKAKPSYTLPDHVEAVYGMVLKDVVLPEGFAFDTADLPDGLNTPVGSAGAQEFKVVYTPEDPDHYAAVTEEITVLVKKSPDTPNLPDASETWNVSYHIETVGDVELPEGWEWLAEDAEKALAAGSEVRAAAVYMGGDRGNYETESVEITLCRSRCGHEQTEIRDRKEAGCTAEGYTGDTYCTVCGELVQAGSRIPALGHDYGEGVVTKEPTAAEAGIRTYTCKRCNDSYTEEIPRISGSGSTGGNAGGGSISGGTGGNVSGNAGSSSNTAGGNTGDNAAGNTTGNEPDMNDSPSGSPGNGVTAETRPDGTKVETKTETAEDGAVKETVTETSRDGSTVKETVTETSGDGSTVKETVTETQTDGTVSSTVTETRADGSKTEKKEVKTSDETTLVVEAETRTDGTTAANSVIKTGASGQSGTVEIAESLLKAVAEDSRINSVVVEITDTTVNSSEKRNKNTVVNVEIPEVEGVNVEKVVLTRDSITAAKDSGKGRKVNVTNGATGSRAEGYVVTIPAKQLAKISENVEEINITIAVEKVADVANTSKKDNITDLVTKSKGKKAKTCVVEVAENAEVTAGMNVKIPVKEKAGNSDKVYIYKYDNKTGKLVEVANSKQKVAEDGTVSIAAAGGTDYVVSAKKLSGKNVETIRDGISVSVSKKTAKAGKEISIRVSLPETVSRKAKFGTETAVITYKCSDSKVASVSKDGKVTTKKKGTVVITTNIKLSSGQKVTEKQKIVVK